MKKEYIQPSMKAFKVTSAAILAGSEILVDKNASGPAPAKGFLFADEDDIE